MQDNKTQLILIIILVLFAGLILSPKRPGFLKSAEIEKGIDLAGGAELRYRALFPPNYQGNKSSDLQKIQQVLETRFRSARGALLEPRITPAGDDQIILQMPGIDRDKLDDYKKLVTQIGKLELKEVASETVQKEWELNKIEPVGWKAVYPKDGGNPILVKAEPVLTGDDVADAQPEPDMSLRRGAGGWHVRFELHPLGAKKFDAIASELYNRQPKGRISIIIDSQVDSVPMVNAPEFKGKGVIEGNYSEEDARRLAIVLRSGSLPVEIGRLGENNLPIVKEPEAENFVGPSLGQDSIERGLWACLVSLIGVAIFMLFYYRAGGIIAVIGILINLLFLLALMALFKATMTLPGIAGLVLTIGMALDANILVLERIREEMLRGKTALQAFEAGYHRAFSTIMDSNLTTLVAAIVMYYFGTGAIQGFAVTLSLGILTTLISVLWCCKVFQRTLVQNGTIKLWSMAQMFKTPNVDFARLAGPAVVVSGILMILSVAIFVQRGDKQFGIDLKGGSMVQFAFADPIGIDDVRSAVASIKTKGDGAAVEKYPDAEIQTVAQAGQGLKSVAGIGQKQANEFQLRTVQPDLDELKADLQAAFKGRLSHVPFEDAKDLPENPRAFDGRGLGGGLNLYFRDAPDFSLQKVDEEISKSLKSVLDLDPTGRPYFQLALLADAPPGLKKAQLTISRPNADRLTDAKERVRSLA